MEVTEIEIENVCRICLKDGRDGVSYQQALPSVGGLTISAFIGTLAEDLKVDIIDELDGMVCMGCTSLVVTTHKFIEQCRESKLSFRQLVESSEMKVETYEGNFSEYFVQEVTSTVVLDENDISNNVATTEVLTEDRVNITGNAEVLCETSQEVFATCGECGKIVKKSNMHSHIQVMHRQNFVSCPDCGKSVKERYFLRHKRTHGPLVKNLKCDHCDLLFDNYSSLKAHEKNKHEDRPESSIELEECKICGLKMLSRSMKNHLVVKHEKPMVPCPYCGKLFIEKYLARHVVRHKSGSFFFCKLCYKLFKSKDALSLHELNHTCSLNSNIILTQEQEDAKKYLKSFENSQKTLGGRKRSNRHTCVTCGKTFDSFAERREHERIVHKDLKPFACNYCPKMFGTPTALRIHIASHRSVVTLRCERCPYKTIYSKKMNAHLNAEHSSDVVKEETVEMNEFMES